MKVEQRLGVALRSLLLLCALLKVSVGFARSQRVNFSFVYILRMIMPIFSLSFSFFLKNYYLDFLMVNVQSCM